MGHIFATPYRQEICESGRFTPMQIVGIKGQDLQRRERNVIDTNTMHIVVEAGYWFRY